MKPTPTNLFGPAWQEGPNPPQAPDLPLVRGRIVPEHLQPDVDQVHQLRRAATGALLATIGIVGGDLVYVAQHPEKDTWTRMSVTVVIGLTFYLVAYFLLQLADHKSQQVNRAIADMRVKKVE